MKRMHLHIAVTDLTQSIEFYNTVFGTEPSVKKDDYAKWLLDDPAVNFAISSRGAKTGIDHIGIQAESAEELAELKSRMESAELAMVSQEGTTCCYAQSDKHWVQDPTGIAWETYHTLGSSPTFNDETSAASDSACCAPAVQTVQIISKPSKKSESNQGCCE